VHRLPDVHIEAGERHVGLPSNDERDLERDAPVHVGVAGGIQIRERALDLAEDKCAALRERLGRPGNDPPAKPGAF
jgi:hypothetical protein